jgi:hypothetical protein
MQVCWLRVFQGSDPGIDHYAMQYNAVNNAATFASPGAETVVAVGATVDITGIVEDSEVRVYLGTIDDAANATEIAGQESVTGGTFQFVHSSGGQVAYIRVVKETYEDLTLSLNLPSGDSTIPVFQRFDRTYNNP